VVGPSPVKVTRLMITANGSPTTCAVRARHPGRFCLDAHDNWRRRATGAKSPLSLPLSL
jgi:hypothetical protein